MTHTTRTLDWLRSLTAPRPAAGPRGPRRALDRRKAAVAVVAGVVVFGLLQVALGAAAEVSLLVRDPGYADKELKLARLEAANPGRPLVLMVGTSRTAAGFHAGRVEDRLGGAATVFNFGIPASGPVTHLLYLKRLLAGGHRPALVLLEVLPPGLADLPEGPLESRFFYGDRLRRGEIDTITAYGFPADKVRAEWRQSVANPWYTLRFPLMGRAAPSAIPWHLRFNWSRTADAHGWSPTVVDAVTPEEYEAGLARSAAEYRALLHDLTPTGGAARALADLLTLCRESGTPVRLVLMPESTGFRGLYTPATTARLYEFLARLGAEYGCGLTDARDWVPDSGFTDGHHILRPGAEAFTDRLVGEAILPKFRAP